MTYESQDLHRNILQLKPNSGNRFQEKQPVEPALHFEDVSEPIIKTKPIYTNQFHGIYIYIDISVNKNINIFSSIVRSKETT